MTSSPALPTLRALPRGCGAYSILDCLAAPRRPVDARIPAGRGDDAAVEMLDDTIGGRTGTLGGECVDALRCVVASSEFTAGTGRWRSAR